MITRLPKFLFAFLFAITSLAACAGGPYTIPVVFHVVHDNGPENIPDQQITQTLGFVNDNFGTADTFGIAWPFIHLVANMQIDFCLAHTDPSGAVTTGVDRIADTLTYHGEAPAVKLNQWPPHKYLNIWVVDSIAYGAVGYAISPATADLYPAQDGVVLSYHLFDAGSGGDKIITRLLGYWLNLENTWGNTNSPGINCGDDGVSDTPPTKGTFGPCDTAQRICDQNTIENVQNYMDVSDCPRMFTLGQRARVWACLDSTLAGRRYLSTSANLAVTCATPTSLNPVSDNKITVSPNPFLDKVSVTGIAAGDYNFILRDMTGRTVWSQRDVVLLSSGLSFDLSNISEGLYLLTLDQGGRALTFKLVRQ